MNYKVQLCLINLTQPDLVFRWQWLGIKPVGAKRLEYNMNLQDIWQTKNLNCKDCCSHSHATVFQLGMIH